MALFITVITCDYTKILLCLLFLLLLWLIRFYNIDSDSWNKAVLGLFIITILGIAMITLYLLFVGLISRLERLWDGQIRILVFKLIVFGPWISYKGSLERKFSISGGLLTISNILIYLSEYWERQENVFSFSFNSFLNQVFLIP